MKSTHFLVATALAAMALSIPVSADTIAIDNPGFEPTNPSSNDPFDISAQTNSDMYAYFGTAQPLHYSNGGTGPASADFLGWTQTAGDGFAISYYGGSTRYGTGTSSGFVADVYNGSLSQDLGVGLTADSTYTLTYAAAYRADQHDVGDTLTINLYAGTTLLATSTPSEDLTNPLSSTFQNYALAYDDSAVVTLPSGDLTIVITSTNGNGDQALVDNFALDVNPSVPEPSTYALMLAGLGLLAGAQRLRRQNS